MTLGDLKTAVRLELGVPSSDTRRLPADKITAAANEVCKSLATRRNWPFLLAQAPDDTLTAGEWKPALPADFDRPFQVLIQPADGTTPFQPDATVYEALIAKYPVPTDASTWGTPRWAALVGRSNLALGPPAAAGVKLLLTYYKFPAALVSDGDSNEMTTTLDAAVKWLTVAECADFDRQADVAATARSKGERAFREVLYDLNDAARLNQQPVMENP